LRQEFTLPRGIVLSQQVLHRLEGRDGGGECQRSERIEQLAGGVWRMLEALALIPHRGADGRRIQVDEVGDELVRVLRVDAVRLECFGAARVGRSARRNR